MKNDDPIFEAVAKGIKSIAGTERRARALAAGYVHLLRRHCWEQLDDVVGEPLEAEAAVGWDGEPMALCKALIKTDSVRIIDTQVVCVDALTEAPAYIRMRWKRSNPDGFQRALIRTNCPSIPTTEGHAQKMSPARIAEVARKGSLKELANRRLRVDPPPGPLSPELVTGQSDMLFGSASLEERNLRDGQNSLHAELVAYWHARYLAVERAKYPFRPRDFRIISQIAKVIGGSADAVKSVFDQYLSDKQPFFNGHDLGKLWNQLATFNARAARKGSGGVSGSSAATDSAKL